MDERTPRGPDILFHDLPPSVPHLDVKGSVQCSNVGLHLYLHLLSDEGSPLVLPFLLTFSLLLLLIWT